MCAERAADNPSDWANRLAQRRSRRVAFSNEVWIGQDGIFTRTDARFGNVSASGAFPQLRDSYSLGSVLSVSTGFRAKLSSSPAPRSCEEISPDRGLA